MSTLGSGNNGEFTFLDIVTLISFIIGLQNLNMNITQDDMQKSTETLDKALRDNVEEIHNHLEVQDKKLDYIMEVLKNGRSI